MERIKPTRSELLKTRKRIKIAKKGHELLKKKQDSLVIELFVLLKHLKDEREELQKIFESAQQRMNQTRALLSDFTISTAALAVQDSGALPLTIKNIAGVRIPQLGEVQETTFPVQDNIHIQELAVSYQNVVKKILELAVRETAVRKMLVEIKKTKRRAHALEHLFIPRLEKGLQGITFELEERSREEFTRLKKRKSEP